MTNKESLYRVNSEIGKLEAVLLHRPGPELERLTPQYLEELLFDDIPWLGRIREEHDMFADTLRSCGCRVFYYEELLTQVLEDSSVRREIIDETARFTGISRLREGELLREHLYDRPAAELAGILIAGLSKSDVDRTHFPPSLSSHITDDYSFYINPLPNLYFTRDPGAVIGEGLSVNAMKTAARSRESLLLSYINRYHPSMGGGEAPLWYDYHYPDAIEGGDMLVLSPSVLAVGCSARTSPAAIEKLGENLFEGSPSVREILVFSIPPKRAYMHLDTVFTMVDRDKFIIYPGIREDVKIYRLEKGNGPGRAITPLDSLEDALTESLGLEMVRLIHSGGGDRITAAREQWNDSTNTLAVAPGKVVTYRRNTASNRTLRENGIEVIEIEGSELVRGRGGPRCMSMPLRRSDI